MYLPSDLAELFSWRLCKLLNARMKKKLNGCFIEGWMGCVGQDLLSWVHEFITPTPPIHKGFMWQTHTHVVPTSSWAGLYSNEAHANASGFSFIFIVRMYLKKFIYFQVRGLSRKLFSLYIYENHLSEASTSVYSHKNICCGYSLEVPPWGTSNEYPQNMVSWKCKKHSYSILFVWKKCLFWSYEFNVSFCSKTPNSLNYHLLG